MKNDDWWFKPAKPWQFWLPQSGFVGGSIIGFIVLSLTYILINYVL